MLCVWIRIILNRLVFFISDIFIAIKIFLKSRNIDFFKSKNAIIENYDIWNGTFEQIKKNSTKNPHTLIFSNKWGLIDPYNGILHFYLSLAAVAKKNNFKSIIVCAGQQKNKIEIADALTLIVVPYKLFGTQSYLLNQTKKWNKSLEQISLHHSDPILIGPNSGMEIYFNKRTNLPVVTTLHTDWILVPKNVSVLKRFRSKFLKSYYKNHLSDQWVSNTKELLKDFEEKRIWLPADKVRTVHHVPQVTSREVKENIILFLGKQDSRKSPIVLAEKWHQISEKNQNWSLIFIGPPGNQTSELKKYQDKNMSIHVLGAVLPSEKNRWLAKSRVIVVPSIYESFGFATAEALEAGAHLVARGLPTLKESSNFTGLYFETTDELSDLLIEVLSKKDSDRIKFDYQNYSNNWVNIFRESSVI